MTDILELAREARLGTVLCHDSVEGDRVWIEGADWHDELERFAELLEAKVRADEREACAKECEAEANGRSPNLFDALCDCADAIRARSEK
jgi:hypothetical protein